MTQKLDLRPLETQGKRLHNQKRSRTVMLGSIILSIGLICVGIILFFIVKSAIRYVKDFVGPNETPGYFDRYLEPAVMFDPSAFDNILKSNSQWKLETAIWASLDDGEQSGLYAVAEDGREILPAKDVTSNLKKYFGDAVNPTYITFSNGDFTYEFNKKQQCYYVPLIAVTDYYIPHVTKISRNFNTVTLTVQYFKGQNWGQDDLTAVPNRIPDKTMDVILTGSSGGYKIKSLKEDEIAQADAVSRQRLRAQSSSYTGSSSASSHNSK